MTEISPYSAPVRPDAESDTTDRESRTESIFRAIAACAGGDADRAEEIDRLREQVIATNMCVADALARRYFGRGESNDDLKQVAYLGLAKAAAGFDPGRGKNFLSYAVPTITGELKKHFRDHCWVVRPPRRIQDLQHRISSVRESMNQQIHRAPTVSELAEELDVPANEVNEAMTAYGCFTPNSLDVPLADDTQTTLGALLPSRDRDLAQTEMRMLLGPALAELAADDREILALRFFEDWTQEQIAQKFGTSQMQISRRLARLTGQLRARIEHNDRCA